MTEIFNQLGENEAVEQVNNNTKMCDSLSITEISEVVVGEDETASVTIEEVEEENNDSTESEHATVEQVNDTKMCDSLSITEVVGDETASVKIEEEKNVTTAIQPKFFILVNQQQLIELIKSRR